jgi:hypothetical protein
MACLDYHLNPSGNSQYMRRGVRAFDEERERQKRLNIMEHEEMERRRVELLAEQTLQGTTGK